VESPLRVVVRGRIAPEDFLVHVAQVLHCMQKLALAGDFSVLFGKCYVNGATAEISK